MIPFDPTAPQFPLSPQGQRLREVSFASCPGTSLVLRPVRDLADLDGCGVPKDAWWMLRCDNLPDRTFRIWKGSWGLHQLLRRHGFLDDRSCLNHKTAFLKYASTTEPLPHESLHIPKEAQHLVGVPQFSPTSGVCWFATLCWTTFAQQDVRTLVSPHLPSTLQEPARRCLEDPDAAKSLRNLLWHDYKIGDDVTLDPKHDGRNGFNEFFFLCSTFDIPLVSFTLEGERFRRDFQMRDRFSKVHRLRSPSPQERHLLVLRYNRAEHHERYPARRRVRIHGVRYRLVGFYIGQGKCGHQVGVAVQNNWRQCSITDADLHKIGCGPIHFYIQEEGCTDRRWWKVWDDIMHVTKFADNQVCNLSPHNRKDTYLDRYRGSDAGSVNMDFLYMSE